jgi:hypothetical protein
MSDLFFVTWSPADAKSIGQLITKKAGEAEKLGAGAQVYLRLAAHDNQTAVNVAVIPPETRVLIDKVGEQ